MAHARASTTADTTMSTTRSSFRPTPGHPSQDVHLQPRNPLSCPTARRTLVRKHAALLPDASASIKYYGKLLSVTLTNKKFLQKHLLYCRKANLLTGAKFARKSPKFPRKHTISAIKESKYKHKGKSIGASRTRNNWSPKKEDLKRAAEVRTYIKAKRLKERQALETTLQKELERQEKIANELKRIDELRRKQREITLNRAARINRGHGQRLSSRGKSVLLPELIPCPRTARYCPK
ncbi:hypothetical protein BASA81_013513 [Batrachochytrium salamandrivorans]|nr:hypothetical protein BASA81_013513 [Batrachochytrium salamandrivorans]